MKRSLALLVLLSLVIGCGDAPPASGLRTVKMPIGSKTYTLEVADTDAARQRGLMERDSLPADHGMIFVFKDEEDRAFWMKHTRIPLDILYLDRGFRVIHATSMRPYDLSKVPSNGPSKYAIELNAGQVTVAGVKVGDVLSVPAEARDAKE